MKQGKETVVVYQAGDIGRVKPTGLASKVGLWMMNKVLQPHCDFFHHFVVRSYITDEGDYEIMEAIASGVRLGRLSWYRDYEIYHLSDPEAVLKGAQACAKYSRYGRSRYDFPLFGKILVAVVLREIMLLLWEHRFRKLRCSELGYGRDNSFVCTEVAYEVAYLMGVALCPVDVVSLPPAIQEAIDGGILV